ncbi:MAG: DNA polymerase III subunit delta [Alphaproteobacteria bacterium]|nr:DNA polymerase III subunit delta [Alphaproteobacteria bacterium]
MKVPAARGDAFVRDPDPAVNVVLIYGPDLGLVRERAANLVKSVAKDPADPFRVAIMDAAALKDDPSRLGDEARTLSMTGGRRVVRISAATDSTSRALADFLDETAETEPGAVALVVVEAGELGPRSSLRKLLEPAARAAAVPCYGDEPRDLADLIRSSLSAHGLSIAPDALAVLQDCLGNDRLATRSELEKLALYASAGDNKSEVSVEDVFACVGDLASLAAEDAVFAAFEGDFAALDRGFARLMLEGTSPVALLRTALRHLQRLHVAAAAVADGKSPDQALQTLRPPVFYKHRARFKAQLRVWSADRIGEAMSVLLTAEQACKRTGAPDAALAERALMRIGSAASRRRTGTSGA